MCCFVTALFLAGPRAAIVIWWIFQPARWDMAFGSVLWPILGFFLAPWTTLAWVAVAYNGVSGFDWVVVGLGVVVDIMFWSGGAWGNRDRIPGSQQAA